MSMSVMRSSARAAGLAGRGLAVVVSVALLAACSSAPPPAPTLQVAPPQGSVMGLHVSRITVANEAGTPAASAQGGMEERRIEQNYPVTPASVGEQWATTRLQAIGTDGTARFVITEAQVVERPVATTPGFKGMFLNEEQFELVGTLKARLEVALPNGAGYSVGATARSTRTVLENDTLNARDQAYLEVLNGLAVEFDRTMETELKASLGNLITVP